MHITYIQSVWCKTSVTVNKILHRRIGRIMDGPKNCTTINSDHVFLQLSSCWLIHLKFLSFSAWILKLLHSYCSYHKPLNLAEVQASSLIYPSTQCFELFQTYCQSVELCKIDILHLLVAAVVSTLLDKGRSKPLGQDAFYAHTCVLPMLRHHPRWLKLDSF